MATNSNDFVNAFKAIAKKRPNIDLLNRYVDGPQPLRYSTERLEEAFRDIRTRFEVNWCNVIIETSLDRISLNGFDTEDQKANDALDSIFDKLHIDLEADKAHKSALSYSSAYVMVWKNEDGSIDVYFNDPRMCHVFYEASSPRKKKYAAKWFRREDDKHEIILYYPDRLEHYISKSPKDEINNPNDFELVEPVESNTYNEIPVFELKTESEITRVLSLQDAINKTFADLMISNEFGSWAQRWVIANADPGDLKNGPNQVWWIPSGDGVGQAASVGQFQSTPPNGFLETMDKLASDMFVQTRTPKHYLMNTGANISGEALLAMEAPLIKKVDKHQRRFTATWQDVGAFILKLSGIEVQPSEVTPVWERVESIQPFTEAQTMQLSVNTGIPLVTFLRRQGWTEQEIQSLQDDMKAEKTASRSLAQGVLDNLRVQNEQNNEEIGVQNDQTR